MLFIINYDFLILIIIYIDVNGSNLNISYYNVSKKLIYYKNGRRISLSNDLIDNVIWTFCDNVGNSGVIKILLMVSQNERKYIIFNFSKCSKWFIFIQINDKAKGFLHSISIGNLSSNTIHLDNPISATFQEIVKVQLFYSTYTHYNWNSYDKWSSWKSKFHNYPNNSKVNTYFK